MSAVMSALHVLNDRLVAADAVCAALDAAGEGDPPKWVYVFRDQVEGIRVAAEALEVLLRGGDA